MWGYSTQVREAAGVEVRRKRVTDVKHHTHNLIDLMFCNSPLGDVALSTKESAFADLIRRFMFARTISSKLLQKRPVGMSSSSLDTEAAIGPNPMANGG